MSIGSKGIHTRRAPSLPIEDADISVDVGYYRKIEGEGIFQFDEEYGIVFPGTVPIVSVPYLIIALPVGLIMISVASNRADVHLPVDVSAGLAEK